MYSKISKEWANEIAEKIKAKMAVVSERLKDKIPYKAFEGAYNDKGDMSQNWNPDDGPSWWTNGFWAGMLWLMYHETKDDRYIQIARYSEKKMDQCFESFYGLHHDVGFMWLLTAVADYKLTGNEESRKRGMHAASLLASRFNPVGKFLRAWNENGDNDTRGWAIIDSMLNIPILYWASEETSDPRFGQIAQIHADTVSEAFIRPDGSVNHIVEFDPFEGGVVRTYGGQGCAEGSSWTRGQAWALYGFVMSYVHTKKEKYLMTAKRVADYFIVNIPDNGFIPVDFRQPELPALEDSTAAAIAASGLLEIAACVKTEAKEKYETAAVQLLKTLENSRCCWEHEKDYFIENGTVAYYSDEQHLPIIYGDYFFIEAVLKLTGNDLFLW